MTTTTTTIRNTAAGLVGYLLIVSLIEAGAGVRTMADANGVSGDESGLSEGLIEVLGAGLLVLGGVGLLVCLVALRLLFLRPRAGYSVAVAAALWVGAPGVVFGLDGPQSFLVVVPGLALLGVSFWGLTQPRDRAALEDAGQQ